MSKSKSFNSDACHPPAGHTSTSRHIAVQVKDFSALLHLSTLPHSTVLRLSLNRRGRYPLLSLKHLLALLLQISLRVVGLLIVSLALYSHISLNTLHKSPQDRATYTLILIRILDKRSDTPSLDDVHGDVLVCREHLDDVVHALGEDEVFVFAVAVVVAADVVERLAAGVV